MANVQSIGSIPAARLERKLGELPDETLLKIKQALMFALDLEIEEQQDDSKDVDTTL
ncbi:type II toxin-antitoxin system PemK/MazF family toxin [Nostoc sp.]|uniref:type II toxin-antitoxin system PemK/MazF family toxin n=1 Tax=Nostoc sp. TaxID=1180 RepID=UPI002FF76E28